MRTIEVLDHGEPITIGFDDLLKYHGKRFIGGVAHGFKAMQRAFQLLSPMQPPERYEIHITTAFPGPGARDAMEMVTRAVTGNRYIMDELCAPTGVIESPKGRYFFRFRYRGASVDVTLRQGIVLEEFIALARKGPQTTEETARLDWLKHDMAERLLALPACEAYDATSATDSGSHGATRRLP